MKKMIIGLVVVAIFAFSFLLFYGYWNSANPEKTCASCHEISSSVMSIGSSAHRSMHCKECHGTALSEGIHSLKEKGSMVINHLSGHKTQEIRLNEDQLITMLTNCKRCHQGEYAQWNRSGHSMKYSDVFLNPTHNQTEQINFDCLRCHGMFQEKSTEKIVSPMSTTGPWKLLDEKLVQRPAIPCFTCHEIHQPQPQKANPKYETPKSRFYENLGQNDRVSFYDRHEKVHFSVSSLPRLKLHCGQREVVVSNDPLMRNCVQCHAPNSAHESGTSDDRTPRGVHEGLSCNSCHDTHSNDARNSCDKCHQGRSSCNIDVKKMNTSYLDRKSPNNIHFVSCTDCHRAEDQRLTDRKNSYQGGTKL